jgi:adenylate cyclase
MKLDSKLETKWFGWLAGAMLSIAAGGLFLLPIGDGLARLSYDLPFLVSQARVPDELVMVYLDDKVKSNLNQPADAPMARSFYTRLLQRLTQEGARLVIFDLIFDAPSADPGVDAAFADAIRRNGRVVLAGQYISASEENFHTEGPLPPISLLADAAAGWGLANVVPDSADHAIRVLNTGTNEFPSLGWVAASLDGAPVTRRPENRVAARWLNYYCPPINLRSVNLDVALGGLTKGYFSNRVVVVGSRPGVGIAGAGREEFPTPYTRFDGSDASGPSIHALSFLNLRHGDWMKRVPFPAQFALVISWGFLITFVLMSIRPWPAIWSAVGCFAVLAVTFCYVQARWHWWVAWMVPAGVQTSVGLVWSVGFQYLVAARGRRKLRRAFEVYLSPYMADQIASEGFDLSLGGKEVQATVMFTDLQGFTKMSENLAPAEVSRILTSYFSQTTRSILEQNGTIIKYIGDAVMAVWGAPLPDEKHAERAVLAAWGMSQAGKQEIAGRRLCTRIGVHTGMVLAGNLGSEFRFDYTLIGDTVNFASRLEGLNKYLGTDILVSEFTCLQAGDAIKFRHLGRFRVVGKLNPVSISEVIGPSAEFPADPPWLAVFARALDCFTRGEFDGAEKFLQQVIALRDGKDGPSEFYLNEIVHVRQHPFMPEAWDGTIQLDSK